MNEFVIPLRRRRWTFEIFGPCSVICIGTFLVATKLSPFQPIWVLIGVLGVLTGGAQLAGVMRVVNSPGIVLTARDLQYGSESFARSNIAGVQRVSQMGTPCVRIEFRPGAQIPRIVTIAYTASKFGFFNVYSHLPVAGFETGERSLDAVLNEWLTATHNAAGS